MDHSEIEAEMETDRENIARPPFSIRLSAEDRAVISERAASRGITLGMFVRTAALAEAGKPLSSHARGRDDLSRALAAALGLIGRIASSSNQLAKAGNSGFLRGGDIAIVLARVERQLVDIREILLKACGDNRE